MFHAIRVPGIGHIPSHDPPLSVQYSICMYARWPNNITRRYRRLFTSLSLENPVVSSSCLLAILPKPPVAKMFSALRRRTGKGARRALLAIQSGKGVNFCMMELRSGGIYSC